MVPTLRAGSCAPTSSQSSSQRVPSASMRVLLALRSRWQSTTRPTGTPLAQSPSSANSAARARSSGAQSVPASADRSARPSQSASVVVYHSCTVSPGAGSSQAVDERALLDHPLLRGEVGTVRHDTTRERVHPPACPTCVAGDHRAVSGDDRSRGTHPLGAAPLDEADLRAGSGLDHAVRVLTPESVFDGIRPGVR